jgi:hypothetical protein
MEKKSTKGGKRKGAGRPAKLKDPVNKMVRLESATVQAIEEQGKVVSDFVREATERRLEEGW